MCLLSVRSIRKCSGSLAMGTNMSNKSTLLDTHQAMIPSPNNNTPRAIPQYRDCLAALLNNQQIEIKTVI